MLEKEILNQESLDSIKDAEILLEKYRYIFYYHIPDGVIYFHECPTNQYKKDRYKLERKNYDLSAVDDIINKIKRGITLEPKYKDHKLKGNYKDYRECHIGFDLLLIYKTISPCLIALVRLGNHQELFKE